VSGWPRRPFVPELSDGELRTAEESMKLWAGDRPITFGRVTTDERNAFLAGFLFGRRTAPPPDSIREALNSGDGSYRP